MELTYLEAVLLTVFLLGLTAPALAQDAIARNDND